MKDANELKEMMEMLAKSGIQVAGDLVLKKEVQYEVSNVEAGGYGIYIAGQGASEVAPCDTGTLQQKMDAVKQTVRQLLTEGKIQKKQDFGAIRKIIDDMSIFEKMTNATLLNILQDCNVPTALVPSESSLKVYSFSKATHPNWKITGQEPGEALRIISLGTDFKRAYEALFAHPD